MEVPSGIDNDTLRKLELQLRSPVSFSVLPLSLPLLDALSVLCTQTGDWSIALLQRDQMICWKISKDKYTFKYVLQ